MKAPSSCNSGLLPVWADSAIFMSLLGDSNMLPGWMPSYSKTVLSKLQGR